MKKNRFKAILLVLPLLSVLTGCFFRYSNTTDNNEQPKTQTVYIECTDSIKINLKLTTQKTLYPTLSNNDSSARFSFSSANTQIASIDSNGVITAKKVGETTLNVFLQNNSSINKSVTLKVIDEEVSGYDYTLMYYMCGSTLEYNPEVKKQSEQGFLSDDIREILGVELPDEVKVIIETGGAEKWFLEDSFISNAQSIPSNALTRWEVVDHKLKKIDTLPTNNMASSSSFESFLNWGLDDYPAEQVGVIISGHGGGIAGCAYDDNYTYTIAGNKFEHTLRTFDIANAAEAALKNSSRDKFTWIGYDCCLMQSADIATINSKYFDYMVASQDLENAAGWNHSKYLNYIKNNTSITPTDLLPRICNDFVKQYHSTTEKPEEYCYQTLSVLDLSKTEPLVTAFNKFVNTSLGVGLTGFNKAKAAFNASYNELGDGIYGLCDFTSLMKAFKTKYSCDVSEVESAISNLVLTDSIKYCSNYPIDLCGVNAFFPLSLSEKYPLQVAKDDYSIYSTKFTPWQTLCSNYGKFWDSI